MMDGTPELPQQLRGMFKEMDTAEVDEAKNTALGSHALFTQALVDVAAFDPRTANPQPRPWLINGVALRKQLTIMAAPGAFAKSTWTMGLAVSGSTDTDLLGYQLPAGQLRVCVYNLEDGKEENERRALAWFRKYPNLQDRVDDHLIMVSGRTHPLTLIRRNADGNDYEAPDSEAMIEFIQHRKIDLLILDPFAFAHAVAENSNDELSKVTAELNRIAEIADCAIIVVHHVTKGQGEVTADRVRGAGALVANARVALVANRMTSDEAVRWGVDNPRSFIRIGADKANLTPGTEENWFQIEGVSIGNGNDIYADDIIPVVTPWTPPAIFDGFSEADTRRFMQSVQQQEKPLETLCASPQSNGWIGNLLATEWDFDPSEEGDKSRLKKMIAQWKETGLLKRYMLKNTKGKPIPVFEFGAWPE